MSGRFKLYMPIFIFATLIVALLLGPPLAFASKLPTACNIFNKKQIEKSGPCGHKVTFTKVHSHSDGIVLVSKAEPENRNFIVSWPCPSLLHPHAIIADSVPLRC